MPSIYRIVIALLAVSGSAPALPADNPAAAAEIKAGRAAYDKCIACHSPERNRTGPLHCGVVGRAAGTVAGYDYSDAMRSAAITWTVEALDRFLEAPLDMLPGTTMGFAGVSDDTERRQLIAWLTTLTPSSSHCDGVAFEQTGERHE